MISTRPMIPMLTHVDNLGDIDLDMSAQEQSLQKIANDTSRIEQNVDMIKTNNNSIKADIQNIIEEMTILNPNVSEIKSTVGTTEDADTATTVIGLLKSIVNKLS